jgi:deazaflavin-dependent oxidoreductase (nitroreductase family)
MNDALKDKIRAGPRTKFIRPFTNRLFNPVSRRFAGWVPGFAVVIVAGRTSGTVRRTPVNVFHDGSDRIFALTYGSDVQWVKNVIAAGGCELQERGKVIRLRDPRLFVDEKGRLMPLIVRLFLRANRVTEYLRLSVA